MQKEEILARSRSENKSKDLVSAETGKTAERIGLLVGVILGGIIYMAEMIVDGKQNFGLWAVICAVNAGQYIYSSVKLRKKSDLLCAVIWVIITATATTQAIITIYKNRL
ncbi:MAG: hypothetical protein IJK31_01255 [Ruminococcus sp.]|nr:hypothetical protein [Ruminococcus sp.]HRR77657.1 DUF6442 family protein [Ruminococcus sp.]